MKAVDLFAVKHYKYIKLFDNKTSSLALKALLYVLRSL